MVRIQPDRSALVEAHAWLRAKAPLDEMLQSRLWEPILRNVAALRMKRRQQVDLKKLQANDKDEP